MMRGRAAIVLAVALLIAPLIVYYMWPSEENRIRKVIRLEAEAVEREDLAAFMDGISFNYSDERGLSYLVIKRLMEREFELMKNAKVSYGDVSIEVEGNKARVGLEVSVVAGEGADRGYHLGDADGPARMQLTLERTAAMKWLITRAAGMGRSGT